MISDTIRQRLRQAEHICIFTGAGVSAESGIQTFRSGSDGLWEGVDPMTVATPEAFRDDPQKVWDFYVQRAEVVRNATPNAAHVAIAKLAVVVKTTVVTQNVDGLHQKGGSTDVIELHGSLLRLKPFDDAVAAFAGGQEPIICPCCDGYASPVTCDPYASREDFERIELVAGAVPTCPCCGVLLRPSVVWFHEPLDPQVLIDAFSAVDNCDAMIVIGSSLAVAPASDLPYRALKRGAVVIEVNPTPTDLSVIATATLAGTAANVLPQLFSDVWGIRMTGVQ